MVPPSMAQIKIRTKSKRTEEFQGLSFSSALGANETLGTFGYLAKTKGNHFLNSGKFCNTTHLNNPIP